LGIRVLPVDGTHRVASVASEGQSGREE
jgi:hypothetical protein